MPFVMKVKRTSNLLGNVLKYPSNIAIQSSILVSDRSFIDLVEYNTKNKIFGRSNTYVLDPYDTVITLPYRKWLPRYPES